MDWPTLNEVENYSSFDIFFFLKNSPFDVCRLDGTQHIRWMSQ